MVAELVKADDYDEEPDGEDRSEQLREKMRGLIGRLAKEADDRVAKRELIERRWLTDLRQYHGQYDDKILKSLTESKKSTLYINKTRPKTNACEARLSDMLFPTDDKNWGVQPTPVPELVVEGEEVAQQSAEAKREVAEMPEGDPQAPQAQARAQEVDAKAAEIQKRQEEARRRARAMEEEIDDHLRECLYNVQAREVIHDACLLGTGIMKGPVIGGRSRRTWQQRESQGEDGRTVTAYEMTQVQDPRPKFWRVDPWNFFPDMDGRGIEDTEGNYERHLMNKKQLRSLAREPGFSEDAIRRLLRDQPRATTPHYISDLRSITGAYHDSSMDRYHVWEYHGPLSTEDLQDMAEAMGRPEMTDDLDDDIDPLQEVEVVIWFCQDELLKFGIHPLDSGDPIYSVFNLEKDEASIFGFGIPYLMRDSQKALNAAWRTMMDNAGLSSGPQIVVNPEIIEPANGTWGLEARKVWMRKSSAPANQPPFETYEISSHQVELANIIELASRNIDEETSMPMLAQGEQGSQTTQTAHGMSLLMNATNVVFRRIIKNFDDDMTTPNIRRMYDFLMQFSKKEHIKGDFEVDARGTSVLLVREMQSANLMGLLVNFGAHPTLAAFLKDGGLPAFRLLLQTMMIPADEVLKTDEDIAQEAAKAAEQPPEPNPEIMKLENQMNIADMDNRTKMDLALLERETKMMELAAQHNMTLDQVRAQLEKVRSDNDAKERIFAGEAAMEQQRDERGDQQASGGYL